MPVAVAPDPRSPDEARARILAIRQREREAAARAARARTVNAAARLAEQVEGEEESRRLRHEAEVEARREAGRRRGEIVQAAVALLRGEPTTLSTREIVSLVAAAFGFTYGEIIGPQRYSDLVRARWAAIHAVNIAKPHLSLPALGRAFGGRDHTTILNALRKMRAEGVPQPDGTRLPFTPTPTSDITGDTGGAR